MFGGVVRLMRWKQADAEVTHRDIRVREPRVSERVDSRRVKPHQRLSRNPVAEGTFETVRRTFQGATSRVLDLKTKSQRQLADAWTYRRAANDTERRRSKVGVGV